MNKLITQLTESINSKLEDVNRYSKMINLVASQDVKAMRKFIHSQDTFEKE
jgi:ferritin